jgi:nucleoside 2-deoxyribosyltransferase
MGNATHKKRIYLAGPEVFLPNALEIGERKKQLCETYSFIGVFPCDRKINTQGLTPHEAGLSISRANEELIKTCDLVIANITPFRGPSLDVGTAYEIGFARAQGLTIFAYSNVTRLYTERVVADPALGVHQDGDVRRDKYGMLLEQYQMVDNLMIDGGVLYSGGSLTTFHAGKELYADLRGFEKCLVLASQTAGVS